MRDRTGFVTRSRRAPRPERFPILEDGLDPDDFVPGADVGDEPWNKVGGTPLWLQGDDTPGPEWEFALQFDAGRAGEDRGDGAIFYGWVNADGAGALGWQCH
jgi:hypothetical protein